MLAIGMEEYRTKKEVPKKHDQPYVIKEGFLSEVPVQSPKAAANEFFTPQKKKA